MLSLCKVFVGACHVDIHNKLWACSYDSHSLHAALVFTESFGPVAMWPTGSGALVARLVVCVAVQSTAGVWGQRAALGLRGVVQGGGLVARRREV